MNLIDQLRQLEAEATPGPWYRPEDILNTVYHDEAHCGLFISNPGTDATCKPEDAALIVAMHTALPDLMNAYEAGVRLALAWNEYQEWKVKTATTSDELEAFCIETKKMQTAFGAFQDVTGGAG